MESSVFSVYTFSSCWKNCSITSDSSKEGFGEALSTKALQSSQVCSYRRLGVDNGPLGYGVP